MYMENRYNDTRRPMELTLKLTDKQKHTRTQMAISMQTKIHKKINITFTDTEGFMRTQTDIP
jgi:hypothetical protein